MQLVGNHLPVAAVGGMTTKRPRAVPSKQWSCSELKEGQAKLLAVKNEVEDDLALKIQEPTHGWYMYHV